MLNIFHGEQKDSISVTLIPTSQSDEIHGLQRHLGLADSRSYVNCRRVMLDIA